MAIQEKKQDNTAMDSLLQAPAEAAKLQAEETNRLWTEFRATGSQELKDKLLVKYAGVVKHVAQRVAVSLPAGNDGRVVSFHREAALNHGAIGCARRITGRWFNGAWAL